MKKTRVTNEEVSFCYTPVYIFDLEELMTLTNHIEHRIKAGIVFTEMNHTPAFG